MLSPTGCLLLPVTEGCLDDFSSIFFLQPHLQLSLPDCRAITSARLEGAIDVLLAVKAQKPSTRHLIAKHPFCRINLSLTTNLSLIIGSWHLWRGGEIDGGGWGRGVDLFREPIYNDSQQEEASLLTFIYKEGPARHSPEVLFICRANPITLVLLAAGKQLYLHSARLSGSVSICFWTARWSSLFNSTGSFSL